MNAAAGLARWVSFDSEIWIHTVTEAQFDSFKDPLASITVEYGEGVLWGCFQYLRDVDGSAGSVQPFGSWSITPVSVPTPEPLTLFLAGLVGLALSRPWRQGTGVG